MDTEALEIAKERQGTMATCIACLEDIKNDAHKCLHCGSYQAPWRNWLPAIGTVVAILTFVGTVGVAIITTSTDIWERIFWKDDLTIISYGSNGELFARNTGSGELFVEYVSMESDDLDYRENNPIGATVAKNSFLRVEASERMAGGFVENVPDDKWELMKRRQVPDVSPYIFSKDHTNFRTISQHLRTRLRTFEAKCEVGFRSVLGGNLVKQSFPCAGVFIKTGHS